MFWAFENSIFQFFASFWVVKLKSFSGKVRQGVQNYLTQNLVIGHFLENCFEASLSWKTNVVSVWKKHFSIICKCLSHEVEINFWESDGKRWNIFQSKSCHSTLPRKWFWSYLELKNECSEHLKRPFSSFLQNFEWRSWNHFLRKRGKTLNTILIKTWSKEAS